MTSPRPARTSPRGRPSHGSAPRDARRAARPDAEASPRRPRFRSATDDDARARYPTNEPAHQTSARRRPGTRAGPGTGPMLRVTTIHANSSGASARYYTRYLAEDGPDGEGEWLGRQAAGLGLSGRGL